MSPSCSPCACKAFCGPWHPCSTAWPCLQMPGQKHSHVHFPAKKDIRFRAKMRLLPLAHGRVVCHCRSPHHSLCWKLPGRHAGRPGAHEESKLRSIAASVQARCCGHSAVRCLLRVWLLLRFASLGHRMVGDAAAAEHLASFDSASERPRASLQLRKHAQVKGLVAVCFWSALCWGLHPITLQSRTRLEIAWDHSASCEGTSDCLWKGGWHQTVAAGRW